jgi:hypothetical protein
MRTVTLSSPENVGHEQGDKTSIPNESARSPLLLAWCSRSDLP